MSARAMRGPAGFTAGVTALTGVCPGFGPPDWLRAFGGGLLVAASVGFWRRNHRRRVSSDTSIPILARASTIIRSDAPPVRSRSSPSRNRSRSSILVFPTDLASATSWENLSESFTALLVIACQICGIRVAKSKRETLARWCLKQEVGGPVLTIRVCKDYGHALGEGHPVDCLYQRYSIRSQVANSLVTCASVFSSRDHFYFDSVRQLRPDTKASSIAPRNSFCRGLPIAS